jgi:hypothetical protein
MSTTRFDKIYNLDKVIVRFGYHFSKESVFIISLDYAKYAAVEETVNLRTFIPPSELSWSTTGY